MDRALGVVRLSVDKDESTSVARQREVIEAAARARGAQVACWAEDLDVSATKVAPLKRPELAARLAEPDTFDLILFWRLDRFVRSPRDLTHMIDWAHEHGKGLASATEAFDLATPLGEAMAYLTALFAKMETSATAERVLGAHKYLREAGRFAGGKPPYGCLKVRESGGKGWKLTEDPQTAPLIREAVRRVAGGEAVNSVVADFNRRGIPAPIDSRRKEPLGVPWRSASMRRMLRSPALLGHAVHQGRSVPGADGMPAIRGPSLIAQSEFDQLQRAMDELTTGPLTRTQTPSLLLGVAYCGRCGGPDDPDDAARLYRGTRGTWNRGPRIAHYICARSARPAEYADRCRAPSILASTLESQAETAFLKTCGDEEQLERVWQAGEDHGEQIAQVRSALANVRAEYDRGGYAYPGAQADYDQRVDRLSVRLADLSLLPSLPSGYIERGTGRSIREVWADSAIPERRRIMLDSGFHLFAEKVGPGSAHAASVLAGELIMAAVRGESIAEAARQAVIRDVQA